jgi:hypothetical protein
MTNGASEIGAEERERHGQSSICPSRISITVKSDCTYKVDMNAIVERFEDVSNGYVSRTGEHDKKI